MRLEQLEERVGEMFDRRFCFLLGRANTGIYLALKWIQQRRGAGEVILPTIICPSVAQIIMYAGFQPVFADVTIPDCTMDQVSLETLITDETRAVIPVHIFGNAANMGPILERANSKGIIVIEDAAHSVGGVSEGKKHCSFGHLSVTSFGGGKIICAGGGGTLLTDDADLAAFVRERIPALPPAATDIRQRLQALSHRNLYHGMMDLLRVKPEIEVASAFKSMIPFYEDLYVHAFPSDPTITAKLREELDRLPENVAARVERAGQYHDLLSELGDTVHLSTAWKRSGVVWRYTLLVRDPRMTLLVTDGLRSNGLHASNHYWSAADLLENDKGSPNTSYICPRLLNLWVDDCADASYIRRASEVMRQILNRC